MEEELNKLIEEVRGEAPDVYRPAVDVVDLFLRLRPEYQDKREHLLERLGDATFSVSMKQWERLANCDGGL